MFSEFFLCLASCNLCGTLQRGFVTEKCWFVIACIKFEVPAFEFWIALLWNDVPVFLWYLSLLVCMFLSLMWQWLWLSRCRQLPSWDETLTILEISVQGFLVSILMSAILSALWSESFDRFCNRASINWRHMTFVMCAWWPVFLGSVCARIRAENVWARYLIRALQTMTNCFALV